MEFIQDLQIFLKQTGFQRLNYGSRIIWMKDEGEYAALADIIPEWLPGQPRVPVSELEDEIVKIEKALMVRLGKRVERVTLMLCHDLPDQSLLQETAGYPDIWWYDWRHARILIFENQRIDFCGLKKPLEEYALLWGRESARRDRLARLRMFQPVTVSLVLINILVFIILSLSGDTGDPAFMAEHGALIFDQVVRQGQYYRLFTALFLHFGPEHLLQNMLVLMLTGSRMERAVGKLRYFILYFGSGLCASLFSIFFTLKDTGDVAAGASGAIFGVMGGMIMLLLKDALLQKKRYFKEIGLTGILFMVFCAASYGFFNAGAGVDNAAHIGGLVCGFVLAGLLTI